MSGENFVYDSGRKLVSQALLQAVPFIEQLTEAQAKKMQDSGVKIVNRDAVFNRLVSKIIGGSVSSSAFHAGAGEPH